MAKITFQRFTQPRVLEKIGRSHLRRFLEHFKEDVKARNLTLPCSDNDCDGFFESLAWTLGRTDTLPDPLIQAIVEIEASAAPENRASLDAAAAQAPRHLALNPAASPECLAVQLWLWSLYQRTELAAGPEDPAKSPSSQSPGKDRFHPVPDHQDHTPPLAMEAGLAVDRLNSPRPSDGRGIEGEGSNQPSTPPPSTHSGAILPAIKIDSDVMLAHCFMPHQVHWIQAEDAIHATGKPVFALAEKSIRIGWTYADAFKNVRKRLRFKKRDYLFATKDYPSALEYMNLCYEFAGLLNFARAIVAHGEECVKIPPLKDSGRTAGFTEEIKVGYIKFDNGSRIIAFSAHPQAMAVYGGDVGLDEFAKHPNAQLLWETAQGRVTWGQDLAVWSAHDGEDTLFNQLAQEARAGKPPWNLYYRVTLTDAIELGLLDVINRVQGTHFTAEQFVADCQSRSRQEEIFQQSYMCNPQGAATGNIVEWSAIERCRYDYPIERVHLEAAQVTQQFGAFNPCGYDTRSTLIHQFLRKHFARLFEGGGQHRLGFDVAASGQGDLAVFYVDELKGSDLWLRGLLTVRTADWDFLQTVLFYFLRHLHSVQGAGDETGLGRMICWQAAQQYSGRFLPVNFSSKKSDLGFALMNQLSVAEKRFPRSEQDIAADYFALRKTHNGTKWVFSEGRNIHNAASHCDIAWAGALATHAHTERRCEIGAMVC